MHNGLISLAEKLRSSYWFIPAIMLVLAVILSVVAIRLDNTTEQNLQWVIDLVHVQSTEAARTILATIASSMITVAGVVFSLTMVVLSLASQQYGSLVLQHFLRDRSNQVVLGTFVATFLYCLLVLRTTQNIEETRFVPHISVMISIGLAIASLAVLVYFIHHVSNSIRASVIVARIGRDLLDMIDTLFPVTLGQGGPDNIGENEVPAAAVPQQQPWLVHAKNDGYLQLVDEEQLFKTVRRANIMVALPFRPGAFVMKDCPIASAWPADRLDSDVAESIARAFVIGLHRTPIQDIEFLVDQLASIAVRALSPGTNDPYTAVLCIDQLGLALSRLGKRQTPLGYRYDEGQLRVITRPVTFEDILNVAFNEIRAYGSGDLKVAIHLLQTIERIDQCLLDQPRKQTLHRFATVIWQSAHSRLIEESDRVAIDVLYANTFASPPG